MKSGKSRKELHAESSADHDTCIICGSGNPLGLKLKFDFPEDGLAECEFMPKFAYEGYKGFLQGGVSAALLDGIMTNCLFSHGIRAFTAEMTIKYRLPVRCGRKILLRARVEKSYNPLHILSASLNQEGKEAVSATAKFMESPLLKAIKT